MRSHPQPVSPPHCLAPRNAPRRFAVVTVAALSLAAAVAPAGELGDGPLAIAAASVGALAVGLLALAIAWRLPAPFHVVILCLAAGPLAGVVILEVYRTLRWGELHFHSLQVDIIYGLIVGACWALGVAPAHLARHARAYDAPDSVQRYSGIVLVLAALTSAGVLPAAQAGQHWSWAVAAAGLFVLGASFVLAGMRRTTRRRAWLARVLDGREAGWSVAASTESDDALPPLHRPPEGIALLAVLVHSSDQPTGSAFRSAPSQVRVALVEAPRAPENASGSRSGAT